MMEAAGIYFTFVQEKDYKFQFTNILGGACGAEVVPERGDGVCRMPRAILIFHASVTSQSPHQRHMGSHGSHQPFRKSFQIKGYFNRSLETDFS